MKVCFVNGNVNTVWQEQLDAVSAQDIIVFGFGGLGLVSYKKELSGETEYFQDVASLSKQTQSVVICGCDTGNYGVYRHSIVIADKGKLLGVSDMAHSFDDSEFASGGNFRVYDTHVCKIGLIVSEDLYFPEVPRVLALCDADLIVCVMKKADNVMPTVMLRAGAFANGVAMCLHSENYSCVSDIRGNVTGGNGKKVFKTEVKIEKDYRLISSRRRGLYREFHGGY